MRYSVCMEPQRYETSGNVRNEQGDIVGTYRGWVTDELIDDHPRGDPWSKRHPKAYRTIGFAALALNAAWIIARLLT